jgi:hypothetical protein
VDPAVVDLPGEDSSSESLRNRNFPKARVLSADFGTSSFGFSGLSSPFVCASGSVWVAGIPRLHGCHEGTSQENFFEIWCTLLRVGDQNFSECLFEDIPGFLFTGLRLDQT